MLRLAAVLVLLASTAHALNASTNSSNNTDNITTESSNTTDNVTTESSNTTDNVTTESSNKTDNVTTESSNTTDNITIDSSNNTDNITTESSNTTDNVTIDSSNTTDNITTDSSNNTDNITINSSNTTTTVSTRKTVSGSMGAQMQEPADGWSVLCDDADFQSGLETSMLRCLQEVTITPPTASQLNVWMDKCRDARRLTGEENLTSEVHFHYSLAVAEDEIEYLNQAFESGSSAQMAEVFQDTMVETTQQPVTGVTASTPEITDHVDDADDQNGNVSSFAFVGRPSMMFMVVFSLFLT